MAKKPKDTAKLDFVEIVMRADAEVIKAAYEARVKIDKLLALREEAYSRIFDLENQVEDIVGQQGMFIFPPPPCPIAGMPSPVPANRHVPQANRAKTPPPKRSVAEDNASEDAPSSTDIPETPSPQENTLEAAEQPSPLADTRSEMEAPPEDGTKQ